jgi:hypothetical protein
VPQPDATTPVPYFSGAILDTSLEGRSLRELTLMRNTIYARAGNPFRKRWLNAWFSAQPWYTPLPRMDEARLTAVDRENAVKIARFEAALPKSQLWERYERVRASAAKMLSTAEAGGQMEIDLIELMLLSRALGTPFPPNELALPTWYADKVDITPLDDVARLDRQVAVDELRDLSRRDLRLLRNTIYARRGREFNSPLLQSYFSEKEWYAPDPAYGDGKLTALDQRNIQVVRSLEDTLGGPLTELEQQASDEWFGGA